MKVNKIKEKVAAKVAKGKAKVARKCGKGKACAAVALAFGVAAALVGCQGLTSPSRSQTLTISDCTINVYGCGAETNDVARVEIASQAMSIENSGSESQTATPTQTTDVKPDIDVEVPVNKSGGGAQSVGSVLGDAAASAVKGLMSNGDGREAARLRGRFLHGRSVHRRLLFAVTVF